MTPRWKRLLFAALMVAGLLGFIEAIGATLYYLRFSTEQRRQVSVALGLEQDDFNSVLRYLPHPYLNYVSNPDFTHPDGSRPHHPIGIRATELSLQSKSEGALRLVALGGSTTYGMYFWDGDDVWPSLLTRYLDVAIPAARLETINAGVPNYSTFELIGVAALWLPELEADIVLVHTGLNDAFTVGYPDEGGPDNTAFRYSWTYRPLPAPLRTVMRRSWFARAMGAGWLSRGSHAVGGMADAMQYPTPSAEQVERLAPAADGKYFRRNLHTLIALIRAAGAEPVLVEMPLNPGMERGLGPYYDAVSAAVVRNNRIMAEVAAEHGATWVPLYARMRDPAHYKDAAHLDQAGMLLKAQLIAERIVPLVRDRLAVLTATD